MKRNATGRKGFTLLEMAIVITVVGLLIAAILSARAIIRTSQLQAVMAEYQMYNAAVKSFQAKYHALPGDFSGATTLWGEVSASCKVGAATGTKTCNGDGSGQIDFDNTPNYENIAAWRHLSLSGFITQNFSGNTVSGACPFDIKAGANAPASKLKGAMWNIGIDRSGTVYTTGAAGNQYIPMNVCNYSPAIHSLWLGGSLQADAAQPGGCAHSQIPVMTGEEAYELDVKYDDKRARSGKIRHQYNNTATYETCEDTTSTSGGYRTTANGVNCSLVFLLDK